MFAAALAGAVLAGCARERGPGYRRVAVVPFENLSGDASLGWAGRGVAELVALSFTGTPRVSATTVLALHDAFGMRATHVLHGYVVRGRAYAALEDSGTHRIIATASAEGGRVAALADSLAHQIEPAARTLKISDDALRAFTEGAFERAASIAPDFGPAYVAWLTQALARGDRAAAAKVIAAAGQRGERIGAVERAKLNAFAAGLSGDGAARRRALVALVQAIPADPVAFRTLGASDTAARKFDTATRWYDEAIVRDPDPELYNLSGYVRAYAGDLEGAVYRLNLYRKLRPNDANPLDSLGEVNYHLGRFSEAERFFLESYRKHPGFLGGAALYKAAWARLMMRDAKAAEAHAQKFFSIREGMKDPRATLLRAQWEYMTGRIKDALARIESDAGPAAAAHMAVWALEAGDRVRAAKYTERVPQDSTAGMALRLVLKPDLPAVPGPVAELARGYAEMLAHRPAQALPHLQKLVEASSPASPEAPEVLLAWAMVEAGRVGEAKALLARIPIPDAMADHPFFALVYPRLLELCKRAGVQ